MPSGDVLDQITGQPAGTGGPVGPDQVQVPGYQIETLVARGGFGWIVSARSLDTERRVAIKIARRDIPQAADQSQLEARVLAAVGAPVAPVLYGQGTLADGSPFTVMEYLSVPSLAVRLAERTGPHDIEEFGPHALAMVEAVAKVHQCGWVHGDIKPENIFPYDTPPRARLVDFGLAQERTDDRVDSTLAMTRTAGDADAVDGGVVSIIGTPEYMAPEQCAGTGVGDRRVDLYALGVIFYEMLTGRPPFFGVPAEVYEAHQSRRPQRPSFWSLIPGGVEEVVLSCLAKNPSDRYDSAESLARALHRVFTELKSLPNKLSNAGELPGQASPPAARGELDRAVVSEPRPVESRKGDPVLGGKVAILWLCSSRDATAVEQILGRFDGQLVHASSTGYAAVFDPHTGDNPAQRAFDAGQELLAQVPGERVALDLAAVKIRTRRDGSRRYFSSLFARKDRFPQPTDPRGIAVSAACARALGPLPMSPLPGRDDGSKLISVPGSDRDRDPAGRSDRTDILDDTTMVPSSIALVGRDAVLADLVASASAAVAGTEPVPTITTVVAKAGHGKSHLALELAASLRREVDVAWAISLRARAPVGGEQARPLGTLLRLLLDLPGQADPVEVESLLTARVGPDMAGELSTSVALAMGWLDLDAPEARTLAAVPGALRTAVARAASAVIRHMAGRRPLLIAIDDAHLADQVTLDALELATLAEALAPVWVCILARPSFERTRPEWGRRSAARHRVELEPLPRDAAAELCLELLSPVARVPARVIDRLVERTQGIPLLLVELVRGLEAEGLVRQHASGSWYVATDEIDRLPDLPVVEWLAQRELDALPVELAAHARLVALMGADSAGAEVAGVLAQLERDGYGQHFPLDPSVAADRLLARGLVIRHRDGRVGFRYDIIRDAIDQAISDPIKLAVHRAAFRYYQNAAEIDDVSRLSRFAFHAERSGHHGDAARACLDLARRAAERHAYLDAEILYTRSLAQMAELSRDDGAEHTAVEPSEPGSAAREAALASEMSARRGRALMRYRLGRYQDSIEDFARARALATRLGDRAAEIEILLDEATALDWCDEWQGSTKRVEQARTLAGQSCSSQVQARLLMAEGRSLIRQSRDAESAAPLDRAIQIAETLGDAVYESHVIALILSAYLLATLGRLDEAERRFTRVIPMCEERGDLMHLAAAIGNRTCLWTAKNDVDRLMVDLHRLREIARELGNARLEQHADYYLGQYLLWMGDIEKAEKHALSARAIDESRFADSARQESCLLVARVLLARGQLSDARAQLDRIRVRQTQARARGGRHVELIPAEEVHFSMVELATRDELAEAAWDRLEARASDALPERDMLEILEMRAMTASRFGQHSAARAVLERAANTAAAIPGFLGAQLARIVRKLAVTRVRAQ